jgi:hypothetical protein
MIPKFFQPLTGWHFAALSLLLFVAALLAGALIKCNDEHFPPKVKTRDSSAIEWVKKAKDSQAIVEEWEGAEGAMGVAYRGLRIDTILFIPLYSTLIAVLCFWAAYVSAAGSTIQKIMVALAWCGWIAGGLDLIENTGIFVQECCHWYVAALPTGIVSLTKWGLALSVSLIAVVRLVVTALALLLRKNGV